MSLERILKVAVRGNASDIILKTGSLPRFRYQSELHTLTDGETITTDLMEQWIQDIVPTHLKEKLRLLVDLDFSYESQQSYRFRVNLFRQRGAFGMVLRVVTNHVRTMEELQLPPIMHNFVKEKRGLILVTGATGSGKTTTLGSIIEKINQSRAAHIVTIEDPIEFIYEEKKATINQREIGIDTESFVGALRSALRQNPDVILVGELRDRETTETALMAAETGHLVLSTLHTQDAPESISRLLSYFPPDAHATLRLMLSQTLHAIVSQRLLTRIDRKGLVPALEILLANELVREQILSGDDLSTLKDAIRSGHETYGMQSFDQSLMALFKAGIISQEEALANASNRKDLVLAMNGIGG